MGDNSGDVIIEGGDPPDIEVNPRQVAFADADVGLGEVSTAVVTVQNLGTGNLELSNVELGDPTAPFVVGNIGSSLVPPGEATEFTVTFQPQTAGEVTGVVFIDSNDPDEPTVEVPLGGLGIAPVIEVSPGTYDFGELYVGCDDEIEVQISNIGNAVLHVTEVNFTSSNVEDMLLDVDMAMTGSLPWELQPDDPPKRVFVNYAPLDEEPDTLQVQVHSTDPFTPIDYSDHSGDAGIWGTHEDVYEQPLSGPVDILFALDKSCSMEDDVENVRQNLSIFVETLQQLETDYQVAAVTADDGCVNGSVNYLDVDMSAGEQQVHFENMLNGSVGVLTEAPLQLMANALAQSSGGCNDGFLRDTANLALVSISDEPEQSPQDWEYYVGFFQSLKDDPDMVIMHAIAGDVPGGCGGNEPGDGHYEPTAATGGIFLSICATDFGPYLQAIAEGSVSENRVFELTLEPVPETIEVYIDGTPSPADDWQYSGFDEGNYVEFGLDRIPEPGAIIRIWYVVKPECEGDDKEDASGDDAGGDAGGGAGGGAGDDAGAGGGAG